MKKKILAWLLTISMVLGVIPAAAAIESPDNPEGMIAETAEEFVAVDVDLPDNDELFAAYVEQHMYGGGIALYGTEGKAKLTDAKERALYEILEKIIKEVADGTRTNTESIPLDLSNYSWSISDLGTSLRKVMDCLLADLPADFYWFDKTSGYRLGYSYNSLDNYKYNISFKVSRDYSPTRQTGGFAVDNTKINTAKSAITYAKQIVEDYRNVNDYEKLKGYKDAICDLTSYNDNAALYSPPYGDPWQLIWVFDQDPATTVVCEGYSKAFQYLCDLTTFRNSSIECYTVTGYLNAGGHMWNIVRIDGVSYLVDVTNCDKGTIGYPDKLFLKGASGNVSSKYTCNSVAYTYDSDQIDLWGAEILSLSGSDFEYSGYDEPIDIPVTNVSLNKASMALSVGWTETLTATITPSDATNQNVTWTSSDHSVATVSNGTVKALGAGTAVITVRTDDGNKTATCTVTVTNSSVTVTDVTLDKTSLNLTAGDSETLLAQITYTNSLATTNHPNVIWTSSDDSVVTVSGPDTSLWGIGEGMYTARTGGTVTAVGAGTATITVTATTGSGTRSASCTVTVSEEATAALAAAVITATGQTTYHYTLEDAIEYSYDVRGGGTAATVQMLADYLADYYISGKIGLTFGTDIPKLPVTLDLNGHSIEGSISNYDHLIITDSAGGGLVSGTVENYNCLEITGGTFRGKYGSWPRTAQDTDLDVEPKTIITGGTVLYYGMVVNSGSMEISGGETTLEVGLDLSSSNMVLSGGMFKGDVTLENISEVTISGGTLFGDIYCDSGIDARNLTITDGTLCNVTENGQLWSLKDKTITISGTGDIPDYGSHLDVPWDYLTARWSWYVESIVVEEGITRIGDRAFAFYGGKSLTLPDTVTSLGEYSIGFTSYSDDHITYLEIPASITRIEPGAFDYTKDLTVKFLGSAPVFEDISKYSGHASPVFDRSSNIIIYYPAGDESWTPYVGQNLGAEHIEWIPYDKTTPEPTPGPDINDDHVVTLKASTNTSATVSLTNQAASETEIHFIIAAYGPDGRMTAVKTVQRILSPSESIDLTVSYPAGTVYTLQAFVLAADTFAPMRSVWVEHLAT